MSQQHAMGLSVLFFQGGLGPSAASQLLFGVLGPRSQPVLSPCPHSRRSAAPMQGLNLALLHMLSLHIGNLQSPFPRTHCQLH